MHPVDRVCLHPRHRSEPDVARILLIDDNLLTRTCLSDSLVAAGHEVIEAQDGRIDLGALPPLDLVVSDVFMPEADGFEVLGALRRRTPRVPCVLVTGQPRFYGMDVAEVATSLGALAVLSKPLEPAQLRQVVQRILARRDPATPHTRPVRENLAG